MNRKHRFARRLVSVIAMLALVLGVFAMAQPAAAGSTLECSEHTLSVTLSAGSTDTYHVVGTLCSQGPAAGKTVQLLLHGITYARYYWDFPYQPDHYSYVRAAVKRGYATFNLDRIGTGASDKPADSNLVNLYSNAYIVHQVVQALRAGQVGSMAFAKVIVVGHSLGSMVALSYAGSNPGEADGVIITGFLQSIDWDFALNTLKPALYPATFDPKFLGQFADYYYLTTLPGVRGSTFYYLPNTDPQVVTLDESLKQLMTYAEFGTAPDVVYDNSSMNVTGPVLFETGQYEELFCGPELNYQCTDQSAVLSYEQSRFSSSACVEAVVIDGAGHDLALQTNAHASFGQMLDWADNHVGSTSAAPPEPCAAP